MPYVKIATLYNQAECIIQTIKQNCNNADDLSKILMAVESMLDACVPVKEAQTLRQVLQRPCEDKTKD